MELAFRGPLWFWRGPAPWHFVSVPDEECALLASGSELLSYGWGMIPATVRIGDSIFTTSLWPKDGGYIVPIKAALRRAEKLELDDEIALTLTVGL